MPQHECLLLFPAMMRSGHHAIIRWIQAHFPQPQFELNDAIPFAHPFRENWYEPQAPPTHDTSLATVNFEDINLARCAGEPMLNIQLFGEAKRCHFVLVLRDPFNLLASKLQLVRTRDWWHEDKDRAKQTPADIVGLWKTMAREFLGKTKFLGSNADVIRVSFNHWFQSREYRDSVGMQLGFENRDHSVNTVSNRGQGSSFDYESHDGNAQSMRVLDRWREFENDSDFQIVRNDRELLELARQTTGVPEGWPKDIE